MGPILTIVPGNLFRRAPDWHGGCLIRQVAGGRAIGVEPNHGGERRPIVFPCPMEHSFLCGRPAGFSKRAACLGRCVPLQLVNPAGSYFADFFCPITLKSSFSRVVHVQVCSSKIDRSSWGIGRSDQPGMDRRASVLRSAVVATSASKSTKKTCVPRIWHSPPPSPPRCS